MNEETKNRVVKIVLAMEDGNNEVPEKIKNVIYDCCEAHPDIGDVSIYTPDILEEFKNDLTLDYSFNVETGYKKSSFSYYNTWTYYGDETINYLVKYHITTYKDGTPIEQVADDDTQEVSTVGDENGVLDDFAIVMLEHITFNEEDGMNTEKNLLIYVPYMLAEE